MENKGNSNKKDDKYSFDEKTVTAEEFLRDIRRVIQKLREDKAVNRHYYRGARDLFKLMKRDVLKALSLKEQEYKQKLKISHKNFDDLYNSFKEEKAKWEKQKAELENEAIKELENLKGRVEKLEKNDNRVM